MCFWMKKGLFQFKFGGELKIFVTKTISFYEILYCFVSSIMKIFCSTQISQIANFFIQYSTLFSFERMLVVIFYE